METALTNKKTTVLGKIASAVVRGTGKTLDALLDAGKKLEPMEQLPIIGGSIRDVQDMISMLDDYYRGRYKKLPVTVILGAAVIVGYLLSPFDLIPDGVPLLGFIDDALIINVVMELCIESELQRYRNWRTGV